MTRVIAALRAIALEALGLVVDDWRLPAGIAGILGVGWWLVGRGEGSAGAPFVVAGLAAFLLAITVLDGRARLRRRAAHLDSRPGGRVPDRDP